MAETEAEVWDRVRKEQMGVFASAVGNFLFLMGIIEEFSHTYIICLSDDDILRDMALKPLLATRIQTVRKLLRARGDAEGVDTSDIDAVWARVDELRLKRNIVAHNPIVWVEYEHGGKQYRVESMWDERQSISAFELSQAGVRASEVLMALHMGYMTVSAFMNSRRARMNVPVTPTVTRTFEKGRKLVAPADKPESTSSDS